jgi:hypothetical protein
LHRCGRSWQRFDNAQLRAIRQGRAALRLATIVCPAAVIVPETLAAAASPSKGMRPQFNRCPRCTGVKR